MVRYKNLEKDNERILLVLSHLRNNGRVTLTKLSRKTRIPVSTLFDMLKSLQKHGLVKKLTAVVDFPKIGYLSRAKITVRVDKLKREDFEDYISNHRNVNSAERINNGYSHMIDVIGKNISEIEDFLETIENQFEITKVQMFYIIESVTEESFMTGTNFA